MENLRIEYVIGITIVIFCLIGVFFLEGKTSSLGNIKSKRVGDGQHGSARWMNNKEKKKYFTTVKMPKKLVDMSDSWLPGRIMDFNVKTRELIVDTSDCHGNIKAPSGTGKTTVHLMPNIQP